MSHPSTSNATQDTPRASEHESESALLHVLPRWFQVVQDHGFLSIIVVAEMAVNGYMMASGTVSNFNNPFAGGWADWLHELMWTALFLAGAIMAGAILRMSGAAFYWFSRNALMGLINVAGAFIVAAMEVWGSIMLRSYAPFISPADKAVLSWAGVAHPAISITDIVVAVALPLISLLWGFSTTRPAVKSATEIAAEGAAKLAQAQAKAAVMQAKAAGWGATLRAGTQAAFARQDDASASSDGASSHRQGGGFDPDNPGGGMSVFPASYSGVSGADDDASSYGKPAPSSRKLRPVGQVGGIPAGYISGAGLLVWLHDSLGVETTPAEAQAFVKAQSGSRRCTREEGVQGSPYIAPKAATLQAARRKWGAKITTQVSGE